MDLDLGGKTPMIMFDVALAFTPPLLGASAPIYGPLIDSAALARVDRIVEDSASYAKQSSAADPSPTDR